MTLAWTVRERYPQLFAALAAGRIDLTKTRMISTELEGVDDAHAHTVLDALLGADAVDYLSCGSLRERLRRIIYSIDPHAVRATRRRSIADRCVYKTDHNDGTTTITAQGIPTDKAAAASVRSERSEPRNREHLDPAWDHLSRTARAIKTAGRHRGATSGATSGAGAPNGHGQRAGAPQAAEMRDGARDLHQIRADLFVDLLAGIDPASAGTPTPGPAQGSITLTVGLATLMCLDDQAGELAGFGPITADIARQLAAEHAHRLVWRFAITSNGRIVHEGRLHYRPTAAQLAYVQTRDRRCLIPGCRRPAKQCDLDHITTWNDYGPTEEDNLCLLCRRHHRAKHGEFRLHRTHFGYTWHTPAGRTYPIAIGRELDHQQRKLLHTVIELTETRPPPATLTRRRN